MRKFNDVSTSFYNSRSAEMRFVKQKRNPIEEDCWDKMLSIDEDTIITMIKCISLLRKNKDESTWGHMPTQYFHTKFKFGSILQFDPLHTTENF